MVGVGPFGNDNSNLLQTARKRNALSGPTTFSRAWKSGENSSKGSLRIAGLVEISEEGKSMMKSGSRYL
jgi:hypothetical protein